MFFDNLAVKQYSGPFGLTMAGISDKAVKTNYSENKYRYNKGSELQNKEFSDGSGFEMYTATYRSLDPQLGRFWQIDPLADISENVSPYSFGSDDPIVNIDPLGLKDTTINGQTYQRDKDLSKVVVTPHKQGSSAVIPFSLAVKMVTDHPMVRPNINTSLRFIPAEIANATSGYSQPPYMKGSTVLRFRSSVAAKYVRVFDSKNPKANAVGRWIVKESEIKGLSPAQIRDKLALPSTPDKIQEVEVPAGSEMESSIAGENIWGKGGGTQYKILEENIQGISFGEPTDLPMPPIPFGIPDDPSMPINQRMLEGPLGTESPFEDPEIPIP